MSEFFNGNENYEKNNVREINICGYVIAVSCVTMNVQKIERRGLVTMLLMSNNFKKDLRNLLTYLNMKSTSNINFTR